MSPTLILFDIDGTLIHHVGKPWSSGGERWTTALYNVFGIEMKLDTSVNYNGWVDPQIAAFIAKPYGITRDQILEKMPNISAELHAFAMKQWSGGDKLYIPFPEAVELAKHLRGDERYKIGLLTGNVQRMAEWKLSHAGVPDMFPFGLFGDETDDRLHLARSVFEKAKQYFATEFLPDKIVIIGDAINDIKAARAIGARSVIAMTGKHSSREELLKESPTLLVETLADPEVLQFFQISER